MRDRAVAWVLGLALLLAVQGCTVGIGIHLGRRPALDSRPPDIAHSRLVDNTLRLDLRRHPTRNDLGMNPTTSFAGYGSTKHPVQVVVDVPMGTLTFPQAQITFATDEVDGASDPRPALHQPRFFRLYVPYPDEATARADASAKAPALGLRLDQVDAALANTSSWPDEYGVPDGWLSAQLGFNNNTSGSAYMGYYFFNLDVYHNPVLDTIKHGDTLTLDARTLPTRSSLGFLPGFSGSTISADPGHRLTLDLRTPQGRGSVRLADATSVMSSSDGPDGPPTSIYLLTCASPRRLRSDLLALTDALALDRGRVDRLPTSSSARTTNLTLTGQTSTFTTKVKYMGADEYGPDACVTISVDFKR